MEITEAMARQCMDGFNMAYASLQSILLRLYEMKTGDRPLSIEEINKILLLHDILLQDALGKLKVEGPENQKTPPAATVTNI